MYIGWIPCAAGFLSFSHIGGNKVRNRIISEDVFPQDKFLRDPPFVVLRQRRNLSDQASLGWVNSDPKRGRHIFYLIVRLHEETGARRYVDGVMFSTPVSESNICGDIYENLCQQISFDNARKLIDEAVGKFVSQKPGAYILTDLRGCRQNQPNRWKLLAEQFRSRRSACVQRARVNEQESRTVVAGHGC
jgi:hypothetical protein